MRRICALLAAIAISITGLSATPAQAAAGDGTYSCSTSGTFIVLNGVVSSGGGGAGNCTGHANIPNGATSIANSAFYQSGLATVSMPNTVTSIGDSAFRHMPNMTTVTIPTSVQSIGYLAFGTTSLTSITFSSPSSLTTIGDYAFQSSRFTSIILPATVTSIGTGVFQLNTDLANISFQGAIPSGSPWEAPVSATVASTGCTTGSFSVVGTVLTNGSTCTGTANVPFGVTSIGANAFLGATSLTTVNLPSSLTSIGFAAFKSVTGLTAITIPSSVTSIDQQAFFGTRLVSLVIPSSVTNIANDTFGQVSTLTSITFPNTLTSIGGGAFYDNTGLPEVTIPSSVISIGEYAFGNALALTSVTFLGNEPATVDSLAFLNSPAGAKAIVGGGATGFAANGSSWKGLTVEQSTFGTYPCASGTFTITGGVVSGGASGNCTGHANIPNGVTAIGDSAFKYSNVTSVTLPSSLISIGHEAFRESALNSVVVPGSVTFMGNCAFCLTPNLTSVVIQSGTLTDLGGYTFAGTPLLNSVILPNNILVIGNGLFRNATDSSPYISQLTSITLPSNLTSIGGNAFEGQNMLTTLTIPASVGSIASLAFVGATSLVEVTFEGLVAPSAPTDAFFGVGTSAKANIPTNATGFGQNGDNWNGLTVVSSVTPPSSDRGSGSSSSSPVPPQPQQPLPKVSGVQIGVGKTAKSSTVKLQLTGVKPGASDQDIQIKIFDVKGNLFKTLTVPINGVAGSLEVALPLALGEFTVEANTVSTAGAVTDSISASSPIVPKVFYSNSVSKSPLLFGKQFARPVSFASNSSLLTAKEKRALVLVSAQLMKTKSSVAITGFVAKAGASKNFEKTLANSRALSVARFLKSQGLSNILYVSGYGATNAATETLRKVELRLIK